MFDRRIFIGLVVLAPCASALAQNAPDPVAAVKAYYNAKAGAEEKLYSKRLSTLHRAASKKSKELNEPVSGMDFSPAISGQDADDNYRTTLKLTPGARSETQARVTATFRRFKTEKTPTNVAYTLVLEGGRWMIDEIENPARGEEGWVFSKLLQAGAKGQ